MTRAVVKAGRFRGRDVGSIMDHDLIEGTLDRQIERTVDFVKKHMFVSGEILDLKREDRPTYPLAAIREIITNAVIHRSYPSAQFEAVMCRIFDDRVEVESPGVLPLGVRVENLTEVQNTRNPLMARFLFDMHYFDEWGQGITRVLNACAANGNPPPLFEERDTTFRVTLYGRQGRPYVFRERRRFLVDFLKREGEVQSHEYQKLTGVSPAQAAKDFNLLIKEGVVEREGRGRSVRYILKDKDG